MNDQTDNRLVDGAIDAYVEWREECDTVWGAYERWARADAADAQSAFAAYRAAVDREERASDVYAGLITRIGNGRSLARA